MGLWTELWLHDYGQCEYMMKESYYDKFYMLWSSNHVIKIIWSIYVSKIIQRFYAIKIIWLCSTDGRRSWAFLLF
mgnify:CR=1 FL=1